MTEPEINGVSLYTFFIHTISLLSFLLCCNAIFMQICREVKKIQSLLLRLSYNIAYSQVCVELYCFANKNKKTHVHSFSLPLLHLSSLSKVCLEIKVGWLVIVLLITFSWAVNAVLAAHIFLNKKKKNCILATDCSF